MEDEDTYAAADKQDGKSFDAASSEIVGKGASNPLLVELVSIMPPGHNFKTVEYAFVMHEDFSLSIHFLFTFLAQGIAKNIWTSSFKRSQIMQIGEFYMEKFNDTLLETKMHLHKLQQR